MLRPALRPVYIRALGARRLTSLSTPARFTSFFFHNAQWLASTSPSSSANALLSLLSSPAPLLPLDAYKPIPPLTPRTLLKVYSQLAKNNLTILIVLTAMSGVALSPLPTTIPILLSTAIGTALCSAAANTLNQIQEVPFDAQMARTRNRPLVRRAITPLHASAFALVTGIAGPAILFSVNTTTALLGLGNIALYAGLYTWLKRRSTLNTPVGSVVGAIPPLMGWAACGGHLLPSASYPVYFFLPPFLSSGIQAPLELIDNPLSPLGLGLLLYSWQFFHFNALSHVVRGSYAQACYQMLSVLDPKKNALVCLRHTVFLLPICSVLIPLSGLTTWMFALTTLVPNAICIRSAWHFWRRGTDKDARIVFQHSLWYLPVLLALMMYHKQGMDWLSWLGLRDSEESEKSKTDVST